MTLKRMRQAIFTETNKRMNAIAQHQYDNSKEKAKEGRNKARAARKRNKRERVTPEMYWTTHDKLDRKTAEVLNRVAKVAAKQLEEGGNHNG